MEILMFTECNGAPGWGRDAGAYMISSQLKNAGFSVKTLDFFSFFEAPHFDAVINNYIDDSTFALCFSSTHFSSYLPEDYVGWLTSDKRTEKNNAWNTYFPFEAEIMEAFFLKVKNQYPKIKIIMGGQKVVQKRKLQEHYPFVDYWVEGMADVSIVDICQKLSQGSELAKRRISSEDQYPKFRDFRTSSIMWDSSDGIFEGEALPLEISRGCPFACSFCDYRKKGFGEAIKDPTSLKNELIRNYELFGTTHYMITDFLVNEDLEKMRMLHKLFTALPFKMEWSGFGRLDLLKAYPEMFDLIIESGAKSVMWGIESIRKDAGRMIGKNCDIDVIEDLLRKGRSEWGDDIVTGSGFIVGLPGETEATADSLLNWLLDSSPLIHGFEVTPLFIGSYNEEKASRIDYSKIQKDPAAFGYKLTMTKGTNGYKEDWVYEPTGFTKTDAIAKIEEYQTDKRWSQNRAIGTYHNYSRFRNLGMTHEEILKSTAANTEFINATRDNYYSRAREYLAKNLLEI